MVWCLSRVKGYYSAASGAHNSSKVTLTKIYPNYNATRNIG